MANPTGKIANLSIKKATIWPWAGGGLATYDDTTAEPFKALQGATFTNNDTLTELYGGESTYAVASEVSKSEVDIKIGYAIFTLRAMAVLRGSSFGWNAAVAASGPDPAMPEVQYVVASGSDDRPDYCRVELVSRVGTGVLTITVPKAKITGAFSYDFKMEGYVMPEANLKAVEDDTFIREDGLTGGVYSVKFVLGRLDAAYIASTVVPIAPTGVTATAGVHRVTIQWTPPALGAITYAVYRSTVTNTETLLVGGLEAVGYVDLTAVTGTPYFYKVTATNEAGESLKSLEVTATPT